MRIGQTSFLYFVAQVVGSAIGFVSTVYFARELGAGPLGIYFLVLGVVAWLQIGGTMGVSSALTKRISEGRDRSEHLAAAMGLVVALFVCISVAIVALRGPVERFLGYSGVEYAILLLGVGLTNAIVTATLTGEHKVHVLAILKPAQLGFRAIVQLALVILGFGLAGLFVGYAVGTLAIAIVGATVVSTAIGRPSWSHVRSLVSFARFSWLGSVKSQSFNWIDVVVLGLFVSSGLIGVYSVAWSIASFLMIFGRAIARTVFPEMSERSARVGAAGVAHLVSDALTFGGLIMIPGFVGGLVLGDRILRIYGDEFVAGTAVLGILILACLLYGYQRQLVNVLNAIDRPNLAFRVNGTFVVVNVVLNVVLISSVGWIGAAVATAASAALALALAYRHVRRHVPFDPPTAAIAHQGTAAAVMGIAVLGCRRWVETTGILSHNFALVLILVALGATVYFGLLLAISARFRRVVRRNLPTRRTGPVE